METKRYVKPLTEVTKVKLHGIILVGSIDDDVTPPPPIHPGAPKHRTPVF